MTRWLAVVAGVALAFVVEGTLFLVAGILTVAGGLLGSTVAGYLASDEPTEGAWHGLLCALAWGIILMPGAVLVAVANASGVLVPFDSVLFLFDSPGEVTTALVLGVTLPNAAAGAGGSLVRRHVDPNPHGDEVDETESETEGADATAADATAGEAPDTTADETDETHETADETDETHETADETGFEFVTFDDESDTPPAERDG